MNSDKVKFYLSKINRTSSFKKIKNYEKLIIDEKVVELVDKLDYFKILYLIVDDVLYFMIYVENINKQKFRVYFSDIDDCDIIIALRHKYDMHDLKGFIMDIDEQDVSIIQNIMNDETMVLKDSILTKDILNKLI